MSVVKTWGNPWLFRKVCRSLKIEGAWGRIRSIEWRMSDLATAASREVKRLFGDVKTAATSQTDSRTAKTATPTPRTASTWPRLCRRTVTLLQVPRTRPAKPKVQAVSKTSATRRTERVTSRWPSPSRGTHTSVPSRKPTRKPPNVRICTRAPSRSPWTAASSISPMISRSTQSTVRGYPTVHRKLHPPPLLSSCRASTLRASRPACLATRRRPDSPPCCASGHRVGLCPYRTPELAPGGARAR